MKVALLLALASLPCVSLRAWVAVFQTPTFRIELEHACEAGCVSCDRIRYRATNKKTQQSIALVGSTVHTPGVDRVTPSRFLGYRFVSGSIVYFVGEDGWLEVTQREKTLRRERGEWDQRKEQPMQPPETAGRGQKMPSRPPGPMFGPAPSGG